MHGHYFAGFAIGRKCPEAAASRATVVRVSDSLPVLLFCFKIFFCPPTPRTFLPFSRALRIHTGIMYLSSLGAEACFFVLIHISVRATRAIRPRDGPGGRLDSSVRAVVA